MKSKKIYQYIKTPCGQEKYERLVLNKSFFGKIRLYWFVIIGTIKDFKIKN